MIATVELARPSPRSGEPLRTRWRTWGGDAAADAVPVLCLHMLGLDAGSFAGFAAAVGGRHAVHAYDQRGHGLAGDQPPSGFDAWVDDAEAAVDRLAARGARRVHLVGSSMGGAVAATLAGRLGAGRIASLCVVATPARGEPAFAGRAGARAAGGVAAAVPATLERWFGPGHAAGPEAAAAARARAALLRMTPAGSDASWRALAAFPGCDNLPAPLPPALCVAFGDDRSTPPAALDAIADALRAAGADARRLDIPGVGHGGLLSRPAELARAWRAFVAEMAPAP